MFSDSFSLGSLHVSNITPAHEQDGSVFPRRGPERDREPVTITAVELKEPMVNSRLSSPALQRGLDVTRAEAENWQKWLTCKEALPRST
jgi:hypothetical protein